MFQEIRIQGIGVIDDAVLPLSPGLNVVTGETGAGKTMVVSGLGLLLGARADTGLVRAGTRAAHIEGVLTLPEGHPALVRAADAGADLGADMDEDLVLVRTVGQDGRSRAHVGGRSTPVGVLAELGELLVAVHGQSDQWRLRHGDQHRQVVDEFGGVVVAEALEAYQRSFDALADATRERDRLRALAADRARETDALQTGLDRIEAVDPQPGEDLALRSEDERLAHADGLRLA
ncbi:MAG: AAA family ATPase, partial [Actinomycetota bacterium]|nr:AAA family ATPase [Actinomycetota bacterium]